MSIAAAQAHKFYEQVIADGNVFTFCDKGQFLVYPVRDIETVPFWSSRSRVVKIQATLEKYKAWDIEEIPFDQFYNDVLPRLESERLHIGVNWSGMGLTGYNIPVDDLRRSLDFWIAKREPT
ncbi:MAG: DUF2750 domain-containing protein [Planctomycetales bacterium]|nr:DUF2750 domain-containing protein [Planctomycetales bacterium]